MTEAGAKKAIAVRWMATWPALSGNVPFVFDNDVQDESVSYARVFIRSASSEQESLGAPGNRRYMREGNVVVRLQTPSNQGSNANDMLVDAVRKTLEGVTLAGDTVDVGVCLYAGSTSPGPVDAQFYRTQTTIPFVFIEIR